MKTDKPSADLNEEAFDDLFMEVLLNQKIEGLELTPAEVALVREVLRKQHKLQHQ